MTGSPSSHSGLSSADMEVIAQRAAARNGAGLLWWILGVTFGSMPLACIALYGLFQFAEARSQPDSITFLWAVLPSVVAFVVALVALVGLIQLAIYVHRRVTRNSVLRMLREGTPHIGRIVQARRISGTQSKVSVQGATFAPFDAVLFTGMPDAALYGRQITVYTRPGAPPMTLPFD